MFQDLVAFSRQDAAAQVPSPQAAAAPLLPREPTAQPNPLGFKAQKALNFKPETRNPKPNPDIAFGPRASLKPASTALSPLFPAVACATLNPKPKP